MDQDYRQYTASNVRYRTAGRRKNHRWGVVLVLAVVVLILSLAALGAIAFSYWKGQNAYDQVADAAFETELNEETLLLSDISPDWEALTAINPDIVGWIYIPNTPVNYPIVRGADNTKYLTSDFQGNYTLPWDAVYGTPFLLASNAADFSDQNNAIQAHNMNNGTMFSTIAELTDSGKFNEHRTVYVFTPKGNYRLTSIALVQCSGDEPIVRTEFDSRADFQEYVQDKLDRSMVQADPAAPAASEVEKLFMFSTCEGITGELRDILFCTVDEYVAVSEGASSSNAPSGSNMFDVTDHAAEAA